MSDDLEDNIDDGNYGDDIDVEDEMN